MASKMRLGSTLRRHTCVAPAAAAAHVRDAVFGNRIEDALRLDLAQAYVRAAGCRHGPRKGPARAMEHRQRPQVAALVVELEGQRVGERAEVGAAMAVYGALGIARGAGRIEQADRVPLVLRARIGERWIARGDEVLVLDLAEAGRALRLGVGDVDHDGPLGAELLQRRRDRGMEFAVGQQHLGFAVLQAEGDQQRIEADVDRVEYRADHGRCEVRLKHRRCVGCEDCDAVASLHAGLGERMCQLPRARVELAIGVGEIAVDHRYALAEEVRRPGEEAHRAQRHEVGGTLAQLRSVSHRSALAQSCCHTGACPRYPAIGCCRGKRHVGSP
jgi:hypothetical protein